MIQFTPAGASQAELQSFTDAVDTHIAQVRSEALAAAMTKVWNKHDTCPCLN